MLCVCLFVCVAAPYKQGRGSFCHVTVVSIATFVSAATARVVLPPRGATQTEISYAIARNQSEITEIWLEIRNQGLENPVEIRKSARNHEKSGKKSREIRKSSRNHEKHCADLAGCTAQVCSVVV